MIEDIRNHDAMTNDRKSEPLPLIAWLAIAYSVTIVLGLGGLAA